jgi:predicted alpha/beta-fold hydrolase
MKSPPIIILISLCIALLLIVMSMITTDEITILIAGTCSPFINQFSPIKSRHSIYQKLVPSIAMVKEVKTNTKKYIHGTVTEITYHDNFDSNIKHPTVLTWHRKRIIDPTKPLIILTTVHGFLASNLLSFANEIEDIINNDPDNEYVVLSIERLFLSGAINQNEEIKFIEEASSVYQMIEIAKDKYPHGSVFLYGYSLGATTIYDYLKIYDGLQDIKLVILSSPVIDINQFYNQRTLAVRAYNIYSISYIKHIIKLNKHLFITDKEIEHYNNVIKLTTLKELVKERMTYRNLKISSLQEIKKSTMPILIVAAENDPILKYTRTLLSEQCDRLPMLSCVLFQLGDHCTFTDLNRRRLMPDVIHRASSIILRQHK